MNKQQAIEEILKIQSGAGVDRSKFPKEMMGDGARRKWDEEEFVYGLEYGKIIGLMESFDIELADMQPPPPDENELNTKQATKQTVEPLFAIGDVVIHKASGVKGIIRKQSKKCANPTHQGNRFACLNLSAFTVDPNPCHLVPDGKYYTVSVGFGEDIEGVEGFLLSASTITPTINDKNHLQYSGQLGINTGINRGI